MGVEIAVTLLDALTDSKVKELLELRPWMKHKKFLLLTKQTEIEAYIDVCIQKGRCVYDLETTGLNTRVNNEGKCYTEIVGICLSHDPDEGVYIPVAHISAEDYNVSLSFILRETARLAANCVLIFHNFKYDGQILRAYGITIDREDRYEDTYLMAAIEDASRKEKGLKVLSESLLGRPQLEINELGIQTSKKNVVAFNLVPPQKAVYYGASDGMNTMALYLYLKDKIDKQDPKGVDGPWAIYKIEKRCLIVTMEMERNLVLIDKDYLKILDAEVTQRMEKMVKKIFALVGHEFDINSTQQLGVILFDEMKLPYPKKVEKSKTGHYLTNSEVLEIVGTKNPIIDLILTYRGYVKIQSTYLYNWLINADENNEVKFQLNQVQADTGRYSGSGGRGLHEDGYCGVNCQNIPKFDEKDPHAVNLRKAMIAHKGFKMLSIDYSGEELRIATNFSREPKWVNEFLHGTGDLHTITAQIITGKSEVSKKERSTGKCVAKGTLVAAERGWLPIEELRVGDRVITHNGTLKEVEAVHFMGIKKAKVIETKTGHKLTCGYNHRLLDKDDNWVRAEDVKVGQIFKTSSCEIINPKNRVRINFNFWDKGNNSFVSDALPYIEINPQWARLLGYLLGDGHIHPSYAGLVCSPEYNDVKEDVMKIAAELGLPVSAKLRYRVGAKNPLWVINVGSTIFSRFCKHLGFRGRREKIFRIPRSIFESPKEVSKEFLSGLFETDGTVDKRGTVSVCTKDKELAHDIVLLLATFGIRAYIYVKPSKKYNRDYYQVQFGRLGADLFEQHVGFISQKKRDRLHAITSKKHHPGSPTQQKWLSEIKLIGSEEEVELWDITVEDDHTYIAQGLVTHNTLNFLTLYGGGAGGFAAQAKISYETAKKMIVNFFKEYIGLNAWIKREAKVSRKRGYSRTAFGRRRPLTEFYNSEDKGIQAKGDRCAVNSAVQGCLQGGERVLTNMGYIPILELYNMPKDMKGRLKVWSGTTWETFDVINRGPAQYALLELSNGLTLKCDTRHEVLVVGKKGYEFRHFSKLDENTEICVSIPTLKDFGEYPADYSYTPGVFNGKSILIDTTEKWDFIAYLMGYVIGDGGIRVKSRHSLTLCFGIEKIKKYLPDIEKSLSELGLNVSNMRQTKSAKGESYQAAINSKGLVELFLKLGYIPGDARSKGVPEIIFRAPVGMRKAFLSGYFNTDGCKKRWNRYGYHTPNLNLLREVQLIGWTLGLSSIVRSVKGGNFKLEWQNLRKVEELLELPFTEWHRRNTCNKMLMPDFLRKEFHKVLYPLYNRKDTKDRAYFCKLNTGKAVTLPSMITMIEDYKGTMPEVLYYHYKLKNKTVLDKKEDTFTLSVHSDLHRYDSAGIISKNTGADVIKIALWRVYKWIKDNNLQDDIKILLPVHDEILFEVREDKLDMIVPELCQIMKIRDVTDKLKWVVPLDVDAEYGDTFDVDHNYWEELKEKNKPINVESALKVEVPMVSEEPKHLEAVSDPTTVSVSTTTSSTGNYYLNYSVKNMLTDGIEAKKDAHTVLDRTEEKISETLFKDAHIKDRIDERGYFYYPMDINPVSARQMRFILETLRAGGDSLFIGQKNKLCILSKDGEVFYKSNEELSVDAFLALCLVFNI